MSSITTYIQDDGILGNIILFLSGKDATSFVGTCQQLSKILPYEYCYFSYSRYGVSSTGLGDSQMQYVERVFSDIFMETDVNKLKALLRNPSFDGIFLFYILSIFTRENKQTMAYLVLDDPRLEIEGILEYLRDRYRLDDGPEIFWLVEHPRVKEVVKDCGNCEEIRITQYSTCSSADCNRTLCPFCFAFFSTKCSGFRCELILCVQCQNKNDANKINRCPAKGCIESFCLNCQRDDFCERCKINRLCPGHRCSHRGLCANCNYETYPDVDYYDEEQSSDSNSDSESESDSSDSNNDNDNGNNDGDDDNDADDDDEDEIPSPWNGSPPGMGLPQSYKGLLHHVASSSSSDGGNDVNDNIGGNRNKSNGPDDVNRENDGVQSACRL